MAKLRIFILLLVLWVVVLFNIERLDILNLAIPSTLYIVTGIALLPIVLVPAMGQIRFEFVVSPVVLIYVALRYFNFPSAQSLTVESLILESFVIVISLWLGRKISHNLESFETVVEEIVFEDKENRILSMNDGEEAVNNELFRARKYERPVALIYIKMPTINRLRRIHPNTLQYQLSLEHRYYKTRIARIVESVVYRVDILVWYGDNLVICLPETSTDQAEQLARQISEIVGASIVLQVPMGIASFPQDGLIYNDLVTKAEQNLKPYFGDKEDPSEKEQEPPMKETFDDPMIKTLNSRQAFPEQERMTAFQPLQEGAKRLYNSFFHDEDLISSMRFDSGIKGEQRAYYNPDYWVNRIPYQSVSARLIYHRIKRLMDISIVLALSPLLILVGLAIAIAIKIEDRGPILFSQNRTGLGGHKFKMYKFRSMVPNAEKRLAELGVAVNERNETIDIVTGKKTTRDARVTRVGSIIRKTSIDELPQLWNVLTGDMSIVGPRPTSFDVDKYRLYHTERLSVKPGITGLWQIHDRGDTDFDNRLIWDIKYIDKFSLVMDLNIMFRTVVVVLKKKGAI